MGLEAQSKRIGSISTLSRLPDNIAYVNFRAARYAARAGAGLLVAAIDGKALLDQILDVSGVARFEGLRALSSLVAAGLVRLRQSAPERQGQALARRSGVDHARVRRSNRPTGVAMISVLPSGENSILLSPGANAEWTDADIEDSLDELQAGDIVLCQLEIPLPAVERLLQLCRARQAMCILDPAPARQLTRDVLAAVAILTPNQYEAAVLMGGDPPETFEDGRLACEAGFRIRAGASGSVRA